jgi:hypothetical protein
MLGAAAGLRSLESMPFWSWTRHKLASGVTQLEGCDTVFIGSSRMQFGVRPDVFDAHMEHLGVSARSFNMGLSGLRQYDHDAVIDWVLAHRSPSLRRMVIELHTWRQEGSKGKWFTDKEVEAHTSATLLPRLGTVLTDSYDPATKAVESSYVLLHALANTFRVGRGASILDSYLWSESIQSAARPVVDAGWRNVAAVTDETMHRKHADFLANIGTYAAQLGAKTKNLAPEWMDGSFDAEFLVHQAEKIRAHGIQPVFVVFPTLLYDYWGRRGIEELENKVLVLEFDDPNIHPELFRLEHFHDRSHMTAEGAELFSRVLAEHLVRPTTTVSGF